MSGPVNYGGSNYNVPSYSPPPAQHDCPSTNSYDGGAAAQPLPFDVPPANVAGLGQGPAPGGGVPALPPFGGDVFGAQGAGPGGVDIAGLLGSLGPLPEGFDLPPLPGGLNAPAPQFDLGPAPQVEAPAAGNDTNQLVNLLVDLMVGLVSLIAQVGGGDTITTGGTAGIAGNADGLEFAPQGGAGAIQARFGDAPVTLP